MLRTTPDVVDDVVRRLQVEFAGRVRGETIRAVAGRSRADLSGVPDGALPELVERLARQYLLDGVADADRGADADRDGRAPSPDRCGQPWTGWAPSA